MLTSQVAKLFMKAMPAYPMSPEKAVGELQEVFNHELFVRADPPRRASMLRESAASKYRSELEYPWDHYFGIDLRPLLRGKRVLDLGCFNGGRGIAWCERYGLAHLTGVDVDQTFIEAGTQFAAHKGVSADFRIGVGERLPFDDESFDAVLSFDVFEHVRDVSQTLAECRRVLRSKGRCYLVFPSYFQPNEHHLSMVTKMPGIQCLFTGATLVNAYCQILQERGAEAYWYKRKSAKLESWERSNTLNGITLRKFRKILQATDLRIVLHSHEPIGSIGRNIVNRKALHLVSNAFRPLTYIPIVQETFLHRLTFILERP